MNVFTASATLLALNHPDPNVRREHCNSFADLVENFHVEPIFDGENFIDLVDALPPLLVTAEA